jgi:hypothetical protein
VNQGLIHDRVLLCLIPNFCTDDSHERDYWYSLQSSFKVFVGFRNSVKSGDFFAAFGVEVHAADRYDHAPAMQVAHYSYTLIWRIK